MANFKTNILNLYKLFSSSGTRNIKLNNEINIDCFATEGFKVDNIIVSDNNVTAPLKMTLMAVNVNYLAYLNTEADERVTNESGIYILI